MNAVGDVLIVLGTIFGIVAVYLFIKGRSEVGTKWMGVGLGVMAVGILLTAR